MLEAFQRFLNRYRKKMERHGEANGRIFYSILNNAHQRLISYGSSYTTILDVIVITSVIITISITAYKVGYKCSVQKKISVFCREVSLFFLFWSSSIHFLRLIYLARTNLVFQVCEKKTHCPWKVCGKALRLSFLAAHGHLAINWGIFIHEMKNANTKLQKSNFVLKFCIFLLGKDQNVSQWSMQQVFARCYLMYKCK